LGFVNRGGKGSHRNYLHPKGRRITLSGEAGAEARSFQERLITQAIETLTQ
jgi:predicted RNA binding protein YcfA (HicA-like mRNA interferase family)